MWKPICLCAVLISLAATPQRASAITVNMPNQPNSFAVLATVNTVLGPIIRLFISYDGGATCPNFPAVAFGNSLTETTTINGTDHIDWIFVPTAAMTFCGYNVGPINHAGFWLNLRGKGGDDIINGGTAAFNVDGQGGHDWLACDRADCMVNGDTGNDILQAAPSTSYIDGDSGADRGCAMNASRVIHWMYGGVGAGQTDNRCGTGSSLTQEWEANGNCSAPCNL